MYYLRLTKYIKHSKNCFSRKITEKARHELMTMKLHFQHTKSRTLAIKYHF